MGSPDTPLVDRVGAFLLWWALPVFALLVTLSYLGLAVAWHVNPPAVPVLGTSMRPTLKAGDLVFVKSVPVESLKKGDVIAFHVPQALQDKYNVPSAYVHRIVGVGHDKSGQYFFKTKGDNVAGPEPFQTAGQNVVGKMAGHVTGLGYPILFFRSKQGKIFFGALGLVVFLYFALGFFDRRQAFAEANALTLATIVDEARALRDSMAGTTAGPARAPPPPAAEVSPLAELYAAAAAAGVKMVEVDDEPPEGAILCSRGCHLLLPGARFDPHTGDSVEVPALESPLPEPESAAGPAEPEAGTAVLSEQPEPIAPSRALVPYAPPIDFEQLEREIQEAARSSADVRETMQELVGAIGEYGEHLRSHTAVMQNLAATTGDLQASTAEMREFLASLTALLQTLLAVQQSRPPQDPQV